MLTPVCSPGSPSITLPSCDANLWSRKANFEPQGAIQRRAALKQVNKRCADTQQRQPSRQWLSWLTADREKMGKEKQTKEKHPCFSMFFHVSPCFSMFVSQKHLATFSNTWQLLVESRQSRHHSCQIMGPDSGRFCGTVKIKEETWSPSTMKMLA